MSTIYLKKWVNNNICPPTSAEIKYLLNLLKELNPSLIGLSLSTPYFRIASDLTKTIKQSVNIPVVWGGIHPTIEPVKCLEFADIVCIGEGEYPFLELAQRLSGSQEINGIKNLWIKEDGQIKRTPLRPLIKDLHSLPFPDLDNKEKYYIEDNRLMQADPLLKSAEYRIIASRGCLFNCSYCYNSILRKIYDGQGKYFRQKTAEGVINELDYALKKLPYVRKIKFDDDVFRFSKEWIDCFCELYSKRISLPFEILLNPTLLDESTLWKLKNAGLRGVQIGIQSGQEELIKGIYARIPGNEQILAFANHNKRLKLDVAYDIILDNPLSNLEDKESLFNFLMLLPRPFRLYLYSLTLFPKTALTDRLLEMGLVTEDYIEGENTKSFRQFRASFDYPRRKEDLFYLCILSLISKRFIPKKLIYSIHSIRFFRYHPYPLKIFSYACNFVKISGMALVMLLRGELSLLKLKEYGNPRLLLTQ